MKNPNLFWKEFSANEVSHSMAHYLVTLRDLRASQGYARKTDIADELGVTKGTVSQQIRHLKERGYVVEDKAHHLDLTEAGQSVARQVIYNRGTLIRFLNKVLRVDPRQAEVDACKMEHLLSPVTSHKLLGLVQLLLSDDRASTSLLRKFSKLVAEDNRDGGEAPGGSSSDERARAGRKGATGRTGKTERTGKTGKTGKGDAAKPARKRRTRKTKPQ